MGLEGQSWIEDPAGSLTALIRPHSNTAHCFSLPPVLNGKKEKPELYRPTPLKPFTSTQVTGLTLTRHHPNPKVSPHGTFCSSKVSFHSLCKGSPALPAPPAIPSPTTTGVTPKPVASGKRVSPWDSELNTQSQRCDLGPEWKGPRCQG